MNIRYDTTYDPSHLQEQSMGQLLNLFAYLNELGRPRIFEFPAHKTPPLHLVAHVHTVTLADGTSFRLYVYKRQSSRIDKYIRDANNYELLACYIRLTPAQLEGYESYRARLNQKLDT